MKTVLLASVLHAASRTKNARRTSPLPLRERILLLASFTAAPDALPDRLRSKTVEKRQPGSSDSERWTRALG